MTFEMPTAIQPKRERPASETLRKGLLEAGEVTFRDIPADRSGSPFRDTHESPVARKSWGEIVGANERDPNLEAAFESLVKESGVSREALDQMSSDTDTKALMKNLAREYLETWRSTASDTPRRAETVREKFRNAVKSRLQ